MNLDFQFKNNKKEDLHYCKSSFFTLRVIFKLKVSVDIELFGVLDVTLSNPHEVNTNLRMVVW